MRLILLSVLILSFVATVNSQTQEPDPADVSGDVSVFKFPKLTQMPPITEDMPDDVKNGYRIFDSLARNFKLRALASFFRNHPFDAEIKKWLKYDYLMSEYDPITQGQWEHGWRQDSLTKREYKSSLEFVTRYLRGAALYAWSVENNYEYKQVNMLNNAGIIAHIRVEDTISPSGGGVKVTGVVLDTLKGRVYPACIPYPSQSVQASSSSSDSPNNTPVTDKVNANIGKCLEFCYFPSSPRSTVSVGEIGKLGISVGTNDDKIDSTMALSPEGGAFVKKGREYIVFLDYFSYRENSSFNYDSFMTIKIGSTSRGIYPIINGKVYDPYNDFGFGTNLTPEEFKLKLRAAINTIKNY